MVGFVHVTTLQQVWMDGWMDGWMDRMDRKTVFIYADFDQKITKYCTFVLHIENREKNYNLRFKIYIQVYINIFNKQIIQVRCPTKSQYIFLHFPLPKK